VNNMASRDLNDLIPEVKIKALSVQNTCKEDYGFDLLIYCTLRSLEEQARLYRQSRPWKKIELKILRFRKWGYGYLADILEKVGPCNGPHVTNAAPGESWHSYGQAFDAVPLNGGKAIWSYKTGKKYWDNYGEAVRNAGMQWAGDWKTFKEYPHAQLPTGSNPLKVKTPEEIKILLEYHKLI